MSGTLPEAGAKLTLDLSEWESNWSSAIDQAVELQGTIDDLGGSVDIDINFTGDDALPFEEIPETIDTDLNVTEDTDTKSILDGINFLATIEKIKIAIDVVGTAINFVKDMGSLVVTPFLDVEDAVARINAQTGGTGIDDLGQFIRDVQAADLGTGVDQITEVVIAAKQLGAPIEEATTAALTFTHTFDDQSPVTVMTTLKATADEFGISITEASDLMTVFFQQGGNKGGDALATVDKYSQSWKDMGLSITEALSLVTSLMGGGVDTAEGASKMIQTFDDAMTAAAADPNSQQAKLLKVMGIDNPKDAGQAIGAETIDGFATAFNNLPADQQDLVSGLFFGKTGKLDTSAIGGMTTQSDMFKNVTDAASAAATEIDNSLRGAIDDFVTEINTKIAELLSSDAIDLPGKIEALKKGFQEAVDVLASGGTAGEALEVALNIPGLSDALDTFIGNFERIIGNLEIAFLQVVAAIQDITGHGKEAAGTRQTISDLSKQQLAFDLQLGNPDEIATQVQQAFSRGVTPEDVGEAIDTSLAESLKNADFDQGANILQGLIDGAIANGASPDAANRLAATYVTNLSNGFDNALAAGNLDLLQKMLAIDPNAKIPGLDDAVAGFKKQLSDAFIPKAGEDTGGNPFTSGLLTPGGMPSKTGATGGGLLGGFTDQIDSAVSKITEGSDTAGLAFDHIATTADTMQTGVGTSLAAVNTDMATTATSVDDLDAHIATATTGNTITASFDAVAASAAENFPDVIEWFQRTKAEAAAFDISLSGHFQHILDMLHDLQFLSAQVATGVQAALTLGGTLPPTPVATGTGGTGGGQGITNNNIIVTNNIPNGAAAAANGYALGASLRGN